VPFSIHSALDVLHCGHLFLLRFRGLDLDRMYRLFGRVPDGSKELQVGVAEYIKDCGRGINDNVNTSTIEVTDKGTPIGVALALRWVQDVLDLKDRMNTILAEAFAKSKSFENSINQAFESFINLNPKAPEFMSLFIDNKLKKDFKGVCGPRHDERAVDISPFYLNVNCTPNLTNLSLTLEI